MVPGRSPFILKRGFKFIYCVIFILLIWLGIGVVTELQHGSCIEQYIGRSMCLSDYCSEFGYSHVNIIINDNVREKVHCFTLEPYSYYDFDYIKAHKYCEERSGC